MGGEEAGEQEQAFEQLLFVVEGDGQQAGLQRNSLGPGGRELWIGEDDLNGAGGGFRFPFHEAVDDTLVPALLDRDGRILEPLFQPADEIALVHGQLAADANRADPVHEVEGLALLEAEEGLDVAAAEERDGFGGARFRQDSRKLMNIGGIVGQGRDL